MFDLCVWQIFCLRAIASGPDLRMVYNLPAGLG